MNQQEDRLDSWKEIADHLKREVRTVSRWERERGLPVHRTPGGRRGAIFAYRSEIDAWLKKPLEATPQVESAPVAKTSRRPWIAAAVATLGLATLAFVVVVVFRLTQHPNPQLATVVGTQLTAFDGAGHPLWHHELPRPLLALKEDEKLEGRLQGHIHVEDLNGDGKNQVLLAAPYGPSATIPDELYCYNPGGDQAWRYQPRVEFNFVGRHAGGPWKIHALTLVAEGRKKTIWAAFADPRFAPAFLVSLDANGNSRLRYVSSGNVNALTGLSNEKGTFILAGGINNEYRAASLAVLDNRQPPAASPQTPGNRFECTDCPAGRPLLFIVLPRSEVNIASGLPYNWVDAFFKRDGDILLETHEQREDNVEITGFFELSDRFTPKSISFGAGYKEAHERMEKRGLIDHTWSDCQEQKHPATARVWDQTHAWREIQIRWVH